MQDKNAYTTSLTNDLGYNEAKVHISLAPLQLQKLLHLNNVIIKNGVPIMCIYFG